MTATVLRQLHPDSAPDRPRRLASSASTTDQAFRWGTTGVGAFVLVITGAIGLFLGYQLIPTIRHYGWAFFTSSDFNPERNKVGIASAMFFSVEIAVITLIIAFPIALCTALYISQYAPAWAKPTLVSVIDLMAAVPSIIYGAWGFFLLMPHALYFARWLSQWFGWIPLFSVQGGDPSAPSFQTAFRYQQSPFMAGLVVSMMVIPLACAMMRNVFDLAPAGEREAALALGSTRWGMIRAVVLPFGRGGIIGGLMLGLGRALGETVAVLLILSQSFQIRFNVLQIGGVTISSLIANSFGEATGSQLDALLAAGFVLFLMTLIVNTIAATVVARSRSGAGVDI